MARPLIDITGEVLTSGVLPDSMNEEAVMWTILNNVILEAQGIGRPLGASLIDTLSEDITHIVQQFSGTEGAIAMISGDTGVWRYNGTTVTLINQPFTTGGFPVLETWGDWTLGTNNLDKPKVRKGSGATFLDLGGVNFTKCRQLIRRQPHVLALATSDGPTWVRWCSMDDVELWVPAANNSAGDFTIRDISGEIKGGCSLGDAILIYSQEAVTVATYLGYPYYFGFNTTIHGVGIFGPKSVCEVNRQNYGLGPQGAFVTDGYQFKLLGDDNFRKWLKKTVDDTKHHQISVFHNEFTNSVEFRFPTKQGSWAGLYWKLEHERFATTDLRMDAGIERDVFSTPLIGVGASLCKYTRDVSDWNSLAFISAMYTKWMDAGSIEWNKFIDHIWINGDIDNVDIQVEIQDKDKKEWVAMNRQAAQLQNWVMQEGFKARIKLWSDDYYHISRIRVLGEPETSVV